jgi:hypothetical protein
MMHIDSRERNFIIGTTILLLIFGAAVLVSSFAFGFQVPAPVERIDPKVVATPGQSPWGDPVAERLRELAPNKYEVYILAQAWSVPAEPGSCSGGVNRHLLFDQQRCSAWFSAGWNQHQHDGSARRSIKIDRHV